MPDATDAKFAQSNPSRPWRPWREACIAHAPFMHTLSIIQWGRAHPYHGCNCMISAEFFGFAPSAGACTLPSMSPPDIRWIQRFENYRQALSRLTAAVTLAAERPLSDLEQQGLIQGFEFTHELAWNVLKDYLEAQGIVGLIGSKGATREAFKNGVITDGEAWMDMIKARNLTSHTYQLIVAEQIARDILGRFYPALAALEGQLAELAKKERGGA